VTDRRIVTVPNLISVGRLLCVPLFCWLLFSHHLVAAFVLLAALGATDWVDGWIARHYDQSSALGKVLDPVADRVLLLAAAAALLVEGALPVWFAVLVLVREGIVAGATLALAAAGARRIDVQWSGKAGTLAVMFALPGFVLLEALHPGAGRDLVAVATWSFAIGGLVLGYWSLVGYVPLARAALREGRADRPREVAA